MVFVGGCLGGCARSSEDYFAFCNSTFRAEVCVSYGTREVRAEIGRAVGEGGEEVFVRYLSPDALADVCVRRDGAGRAVVTPADGTLAYEADAAALSGLLSPAEALLSCSHSVRSVRRESGEVILALEDGATLVLDGADYTPRRITTPDGVSVTVVWWE